MKLDRRWSRLLDRHRRSLSAVLAGLAVLCLGLALRPPRLVTVSVPVAAQSLPAGHRLGQTDIRLTEVAATLAPASRDRTTPERLLGSILAAPVGAGEPLSPARLLDPGARGWVAEPGHHPLPVRFADPGAVNLLDAGQRLDVLASAPAAEAGLGSARASVVAESVLVLAVVRSAAAEGSGLLGAPADDDATRADLVVLSATREQALGIAGAEAGSRLSFALVPDPADPDPEAPAGQGSLSGLPTDP